MRRAVVALAIAAGVAAGAARATQPPIIGQPVDPPAVGAATPASSAVRPVRLTLQLGSYPLICGRPRGAVVVTFPTAVTLPPTIAAGAVEVNGQAAARVALSGHEVTVTAPLAKGVTCQSITLGRLTLVFTHRANIGNPTAAGRYSVSVRHGTQKYRATLTISV